MASCAIKYLVEHTHTDLSKVRLPMLHSYKYTSPQSTFIYSNIKYIGTFQSCLVYPGHHFKNLTWEVLNTIFPLHLPGYQHHFFSPLPGIWKTIAPVDHLQIELAVPSFDLFFLGSTTGGFAKRNVNVSVSLKIPNIQASQEYDSCVSIHIPVKWSISTCEMPKRTRT